MSYQFGWIQEFLHEDGNEFFVEIDRQFLLEKHTKTGFAEQITYFKYALNVIFDIENDAMKALSFRQREIAERDAKVLYGLTHSRYICSSAGQYKMLEKFKRGQFGLCNRTFCEKCPMLPIGLSNHKDVATLKLYCPKCKQIYNPTNTKYDTIDGAYFGTIFPHLFFMVLPECKPKESDKVYKAQIFGFDINKNWHQYCSETKQDQIDDFMKFQEIEKKQAMMFEAETSGKVIIDVQRQLDQNSKNVWNELQNELKQIHKIDNDGKAQKQKPKGTETKNNCSDNDDKKETFEKKSACKAFVALDFGTNTSKIGYCLANNDNIYDKEIKSAILLDGNGEFIAFGDEAVETYMNMKDNKLLFFENYVRKMLDVEDEKGEINLIAANGKEYPFSLVFIQSLKYLKEIVMHWLNDNGANIVNIKKDIFWVIPHRSNMDNDVKEKLIEYFIVAGIIDKCMTDNINLMFSLSTNCGSMDIVNEIKDFVHAKSIKNIEYIAMDIGADRVDFLCEKMFDDKRRKLLNQSYGKWGDIQIESAFIDILCKIFAADNKEWINTFKLQQSDKYLLLLNNFRKSKLAFYSHTQWHCVDIPFEFIQFMQNKLANKNIEKVVKEFEFNEWENCFILNGNVLSMHNNIWINELFDIVVNKIINHLNQLLAKKKMRFCQYLYIMGGFAENQYLQKRLNEEYNDFTKYKLDVIISRNMRFLVLNGAVKIAKNKGITFKFTKQKCYHCNKDLKQKRLRCSACKRTYYCSTQCQKANWKTHQQNCKKWRK